MSTLIQNIVSAGIIQFGSFVLKSGQKSNVYFDFRKIISHPKLLLQIAHKIKLLIDEDVDIICGVPMGGIPYAVSVSNITGIPGIMVRKDVKTHGLSNYIEGDYIGKKCILIEDVVTTGGSVIETANNMVKYGVNIVKIITVLDRGGLQNIKNSGYNAVTLWSETDLLEGEILLTKPSIHYLENSIVVDLIKLANTKLSNLILSLDLVDPLSILKIVDIVGPHIVGIKLHLDIINFTTLTFDKFSSYLTILKKIHNFVIIEDRKFADIGSIVVKQFAKFKNIVDIVTVYGITGQHMVQSLDNLGVGLLLVHQLSTSGSLIDPYYSLQIEDMAKNCKNIVGFISQEKVSGYLTFSPGIHIADKSDGIDQQYRSPSDIETTDFFIVGRGIYSQSADTILPVCQEYQKQCWYNFKHKIYAKL